MEASTLPGAITRSLKGATLRAATWVSRVEVSSALASTSTSPVSASTTRLAVRRPTRDSARTGILSTPASLSFSMSLALSVLPPWTRGSLWRGGLTSSATLMPACASGVSFTHAMRSSKESTSSRS